MASCNSIIYQIRKKGFYVRFTQMGNRIRNACHLPQFANYRDILLVMWEFSSCECVAVVASKQTYAKMGGKAKHFTKAVIQRARREIRALGPHKTVDLGREFLRRRMPSEQQVLLSVMTHS